jgi:hypothetical protein
MSQDLPGMFGDLEPVLEHYGYLAVGGFVLLEDFGVPLPLGALLWVTTWGLLGSHAGQYIGDVYTAFHPYRWDMGAAAVVIVGALLVRRIRLRQRSPAEAP